MLRILFSCNEGLPAKSPRHEALNPIVFPLASHCWTIELSRCPWTCVAVAHPLCHITEFFKICRGKVGRIRDEESTWRIKFRNKRWLSSISFCICQEMVCCPYWANDSTRSWMEWAVSTSVGAARLSWHINEGGQLNKCFWGSVVKLSVCLVRNWCKRYIATWRHWFWLKAYRRHAIRTCVDGLDV